VGRIGVRTQAQYTLPSFGVKPKCLRDSISGRREGNDFARAERGCGEAMGEQDAAIADDRPMVVRPDERGEVVDAEERDIVWCGLAQAAEPDIRRAVVAGERDNAVQDAEAGEPAEIRFAGVGGHIVRAGGYIGAEGRRARTAADQRCAAPVGRVNRRFGLRAVECAH
jgi:hypothetical protein